MSFSIVDTRTTLSLYFNWFCEWKARHDMRGKLTDFNIVKRIFDECGLELISDKSKYETCHSKLDYICKNIDT